MVHDPRAPQLAAVATLIAAVLVLLTALNLVLNVVGSSGLSLEEGVAVAGVALFLVVANLANKERAIPELTPNQTPTDVETFAVATTPLPSATQTDVNPTTASILTSILGEQATTDQRQVNSAIEALTSGEFGAAVRRTMEDIEAANQTTNDQREALPADEETGQSLERVVVQPVPLPGRENRSPVDPSTIPGLEPNRVFVTTGVASVPLPTLEEQRPATTTASALALEAPALPAPNLPDLPDLPDLPERHEPLASLASPELPTQNEEGALHEDHVPPALDLPDLDGLFTDEVEATPAVSVPDLPDLPDLDDLF